MADSQKKSDVSDAVYDAVKFAKLVKKNYGRSSLTRSAKDTIALFPCIMSADIEIQNAMTLAKGLEAQYAALMVSVISVNSDFNRKTYTSVADYLKTFHNNSNMPAVVLPGTESQVEVSFSCEMVRATMVPGASHLVGEDVVMECWDNAAECFNASSINDVYKPAAHTQEIMSAVVESLRGLDYPVMEADAPTKGMPRGAYAMNNMGRGSGVNSNNVGVPGSKSMTTRTQPVKDEDGNTVLDRKGNPMLEKATDVKTSSAETGKQVVVRNDRMTMMEPTIINIQLTSHAGEGSAVITHNVVMAIKATVRLIPSNLMVDNLSDAVMGSRKIFKFLRWQTGEYSFIKDFIFGVEDAKDTAVRSKDMRNWIAALKRRKKASVISSILGTTSIPPITTIVCTAHEVAQVAERTGIDLLEPYNALKLLTEYYLLGFIIFDSSTGKISSFFDGDTQYSVTSINSLQGKQGKDIDISVLTTFLKGSGRM